MALLTTAESKSQCSGLFLLICYSCNPINLTTLVLTIHLAHSDHHEESNPRILRSQLSTLACPARNFM